MVSLYQPPVVGMCGGTCAHGTCIWKQQLPFLYIKVVLLLSSTTAAWNFRGAVYTVRCLRAAASFQLVCSGSCIVELLHHIYIVQYIIYIVMDCIT